MAENWPKVKARHTRRVSPWMAIIEREVEFAPGAECEIYHAVSQQDYIAIVAPVPDGRLPIVRQYRPALESFTRELPAELIDPALASAVARQAMDSLDRCMTALLDEEVEAHGAGFSSAWRGRHGRSPLWHPPASAL
jgi:hypothetical protein